MVKQTGQNKRCIHCSSERTAVMSKWRYVFFMSTLPVIMAVFLGWWMSSFFFIFIPAVIVLNSILASKKPPVIMCMDCRKETGRAARSA
ncbi:hypothetical protein [Sinobaca sp. H24]|uniref:hypothetical protein n=1 Tax=Sinobaca sp. H24 TaxID=2923376 RepID=UPI002079335A|nr:hypothetical protein [Sinobaca sp. H24]